MSICSVPEFGGNVKIELLVVYTVLFMWYCVTIVMGTREAALDAQTISLVSELGNEQLRNIKTDVVSFDPRVFNQKIVSKCITLTGR